jgi:hypothetical protein
MIYSTIYLFCKSHSEQFLNLSSQASGSHRLRDVGSEARGQSSFAIALHGVSRNRDDWQVRKAGLLPNILDNPESVENRHIDVQ